MATPIPQPKGVPLLGNIFDVDPNNTWWSLKKLADTHGEIFQIKVLGHAIVFVASAALAEELCDERRFRKYVGGPIVEIRAAVHDALFTAYDHETSWGVAHRIVAPRLLSPGAVAEGFGEMRDTAAELVSRWRGFKPGQPVALLTELNRLNLEATTLVLYGMRLNALGRDHPMLQGMETSTAEAVRRPTRPGFLNWLLYGRRFKSSVAAMRAYAQEVVDHRKANPTDRQDVLTAMMKSQDPETGRSLTESQILDEIISMPIGSSTAPCLITSAVLFLARNPAALATAREELISVLGPVNTNGDGGILRHEYLSQLPYLEAVMHESLRLANPAPGFNIEPVPDPHKRPVQLAGGKYEVAHDQPMIIVLAGANRDPAIFDSPLEFRPERMLGREFDRLPLGARRYFGNGKRECIGRLYARQWMMVTLATLIRHVDFELVDPNYDLVQDGWFNVRPVDLFVKVKMLG